LSAAPRLKSITEAVSPNYDRYADDQRLRLSYDVTRRVHDRSVPQMRKPGFLVFGEKRFDYLVRE
jgi:hypothetical protein